MKLPRPVVVLLFALAIATGTASADSVTFEFTGTIGGPCTRIGCSDGPGVYNRGIPGFNINIGDPFFGSFSYDPAVVTFSSTVSDPVGGSAQYPALSFQTTIDNFVFTATNPEINITNDGEFNQFNVFGGVGSGTYMNFELVGDRLWPTYVLPDILDLANWCCGADIAFNDYSHPTDFPGQILSDPHVVVTYDVDGPLTSLNQVSEPPSIILLLSGIPLLIFALKKRRGYHV